MSEKLSDEEVEEAVEKLQIWGYQFEKLKTEIEFGNYKEAAFFANTVFSLAEENSHHPEVTVAYGSVKIDLWSHEADGVTEEDLDMAEMIEEKLRHIEWT